MNTKSNVNYVATYNFPCVCFTALKEKLCSFPLKGYFKFNLLNKCACGHRNVLSYIVSQVQGCKNIRKIENVEPRWNDSNVPTSDQIKKYLFLYTSTIVYCVYFLYIDNYPETPPSHLLVFITMPHSNTIITNWTEGIRTWHISDRICTSVFYVHS